MKVVELFIDHRHDLKSQVVACWRYDVTFLHLRTCAKLRSLITSRRLCFCLICLILSLFFVEPDFQLNSHLTTLASIHKIHHTLHRLVNAYWQLCFTCVSLHCVLLSMSSFCDRTWQKTLDRTATPRVILQLLLLCFMVNVKHWPCIKLLLKRCVLQNWTAGSLSVLVCVAREKYASSMYCLQAVLYPSMFHFLS